MPPDAVTTTTDSTLHAALPAERRQLFEEGCARHKDAIAAVREGDLEAALYKGHCADVRILEHETGCVIEYAQSAGSVHADVGRVRR